MQNNNLDTYKLLFLIKGILTLCFSLFFIIYALFGFFIGYMTSSDPYASGLSFNPGYIFLIVGGVGFIFTIALGTLAIVASNYLKHRKNYNFIYVVAIVNALTGVLGILLAVFTLIELSKPEVKKLFK